MLFGSQASFALESELDSPPAEHLFGRICIWAGKRRLGDYEQAVILTVPSAFFRESLDATGRRRDDALNGKDGKEVLGFLDSVLFGEANRPLDQCLELEERFGKFLICPGGGEPFDGELAALLEHSHGARFIWRDYNDMKIYEVALAPGEYESAVQQFLDWVDRQVVDKLS